MKNETLKTAALPASNNPQSNQPVATALDAARRYVHAATSDNTRKAYRSAIRQFEKWGGRLPTERDVLARYLLERAEQVNPRTLDLHLTAISQWHQTQGMVDPVRDPLIRKTMEGIRRVHGRPKQKAKPLRLEHLTLMVTHLRKQPETRKIVRDLAMLLVGFFGAFRRSELVQIQCSDLTWEPEGLIVRIPRSKTDQTSEGIFRVLPFGNEQVCPTTALKYWLNVSGIKNGPIFRPVNRWDQIINRALNPTSINALLKKLGGACQFDFVPELSSHSLRRGMSTSAAREGVEFELIKKQGGWRSDAVVRGYIEEGQQFSSNATLILMEKMRDLMNENADEMD